MGFRAYDIADGVVVGGGVDNTDDLASTDSGKGASLIGIYDPDNAINAETVNGALLEQSSQVLYDSLATQDAAWVEGLNGGSVSIVSNRIRLTRPNADAITGMDRGSTDGLLFSAPFSVSCYIKNNSAVHGSFAQLVVASVDDPANDVYSIGPEYFSGAYRISAYGTAAGWTNSAFVAAEGWVKIALDGGQLVSAWYSANAENDEPNVHSDWSLVASGKAFGGRALPSFVSIVAAKSVAGVVAATSVDFSHLRLRYRV